MTYAMKYVYILRSMPHFSAICIICMPEAQRNGIQLSWLPESEITSMTAVKI